MRTQFHLEIVRNLPTFIELALKYGKVMLLLYKQTLFVVNDLIFGRRMSSDGGTSQWQRRTEPISFSRVTFSSLLIRDSCSSWRRSSMFSAPIDFCCFAIAS